MTTSIATIRRFEDATLAAWPALETLRDGSWLVRLSGGFTSRSNSINFLDPSDDADAAHRLEAAAAAYHARRLPPLVRATPLTPSAVLAIAGKAGWRRHKDSLVMARAMAGDDDLPEPEEAPTTPDTRWLTTMQRVMGFSDEKREGIARKLARLAGKAGFLLGVNGGGIAVATTLAVVVDHVAVLNEVGVDPGARQRGNGRAVLARALAWARAQGAREAVLQVQADNAAGLALYRRLGFVASHAYHYLAAPEPEDRR